MSRKSLQTTVLIFSATISAVFVVLALSDRVSLFNLLLFAALSLTAVGIGLTIGGRKLAPVLASPLVPGLDPDPSRPWAAMLNSRGRGRRRW